jgi:tripartite-type tricarboxylate transporter receptor subunit TctC
VTVVSRISRIALIFCLTALAQTGWVFAQEATFSKPVRIVISFPPAGPTDSTIRIIADELGKALGQSVYIENRAGAGGNVGAQYVAKATPDGYTFLASSSAYAVNPSLYAGKAGYNPEKDFVSVITISKQPNVISVGENVPVKNLAELKEYAKTNKLSFSSPGTGTTPHLTCENVFHAQWKSDIVHIPYRGAGPASLAVYSGETPLACTAAYGVFQFYKQGKVKILAVSADQRMPSLPNVPTFLEEGYKDINDYTWTTLFAPTGTPPTLIEKMNIAINQIIAKPEFIEKFDKGGLIPVGGSVAETGKYISSELKHWGDIVKMLDLKPEQ